MFSTKNVVYAHMDTVLRMKPSVDWYGRMIMVISPIHADIFQVNFNGLIVHSAQQIRQKDEEFKIIHKALGKKGKGHLVHDYEYKPEVDNPFMVRVDPDEVIILCFTYEIITRTHVYRPRIDASADSFILHTLVKDFAHLNAGKEAIMGTTMNQVVPSLEIPVHVDRWVASQMRGTWKVGNVTYKDETRNKVVHVSPIRVDPPEAVVRIAGYTLFDPETEEPWIVQQMVNARDVLCPHKEYRKRTVHITNDIRDGYVVTEFDHRNKKKASYEIDVEDGRMDTSSYAKGPCIYIKKEH